MALNPLNSSNLEQLALKGLMGDQISVQKDECTALRGRLLD